MSWKRSCLLGNTLLRRPSQYAAAGTLSGGRGNGPLSRDHQAVKRAVKQTRNDAARARRGSLPGKAELVTLLEATPIAGAGAVVTSPARRYVLAIGAKEPSRAYLLRQLTDGTWTCD